MARSSRSDSAPADRRKSRALDTNPELATNDFRRTGPSGVVLMILAGALVGGGLGFLALPGILSPKPAPPPPPPAEAKPLKSKTDSKTDSKTEAPGGYESEKLYPHKNALTP